MTPPRRKKWTEAEEKTLIEKYGDMVSDGTLARMKTREKKYRPIACYVNTVNHNRDSISYPWLWTWKDVSTKVQNMRHQYLLVKQKIKKPELSVGNSGSGESTGEEFDWLDGVTHWSNFLRYKDVLGDVVGPYNTNGINNNGNDMGVAANENGGGFVGEGSGLEIVDFGQMGHSDGDFTGIGEGENGVLGLGFEYNGDKVENYVKEDRDEAFMYEEAEQNGSNLRKKRKIMKKKAFGFLANQFRQLREIEARFEQNDADRERERQRREKTRSEAEEEQKRKIEEREIENEEREKARENIRKQKILDLEAIEKENEENEKKRQDVELIRVELIREREFEERMNRKRSEWKKRTDDMMTQHRVEMEQMQTRIIHEQQNVSNQMLGIVSQWTGHQTTISDHTSASNHYLNQMMQNLHHVSGMVHGDDSRVEGDNQDDQFIVGD